MASLEVRGREGSGKNGPFQAGKGLISYPERADLRAGEVVGRGSSGPESPRAGDGTAGRLATAPRPVLARVTAAVSSSRPGCPPHSPGWSLRAADTWSPNALQQFPRFRQVCQSVKFARVAACNHFRLVLQNKQIVEKAPRANLNHFDSLNAFETYKCNYFCEITLDGDELVWLNVE